MACNNLEETNERIRVLEEQVKSLQETFTYLSIHYHDFVKATIQTFKESAEEE